MHKRSGMGITLIALIITIIVMLILASVSIKVAISGGILNKSEEAIKTTQIQIDREKLQTIITSKYNSKTGTPPANLEGNDLPDGWEIENNIITSDKGTTFYYDGNGNIELIKDELSYSNLIFEVINEENKEVSVKANKGDQPFGFNIDIGENIKIPAKVLKNNQIYTVTSIAFTGFGGTTIKEIDMPNTITSIGQDAFSYCNNLINIKIPRSVTTIGWYAFSDCTAIKNITLEENVTNMSPFVFNNWTNQQKVTVYWENGNRPEGWNENWEDSRYDDGVNTPRLISPKFSIIYK